MIGLEAFISRCSELETLYGERFAAPKILLDKAKANESFV